MNNLLAPLIALSCLLHSLDIKAYSNFDSELFSPPLFTSNANRSLANKRILKLEQDDRGFIWVGTGKGVFRFDGYSYEKLLAANESVDLSVIYVRSLLADGDYLWIGSMSQGAFRVDLRTRQTLHFVNELENSKSLGGNQVNSIKKDAKGNIWLAHSFGLDKYNPEDSSFTRYYSGSDKEERYHNYLLDMEFDLNGTLWLSSAKGVALFSENKSAFYLFNQTNNSEQSASLLTDVIVRRFYLSSDGRLWLATQKQGTFIIEPSDNRVIKLSGNQNRSEAVNTAIAEVGAHNSSYHQVWVSGTTGIEIRDGKSGKLLKVLRGNQQDEYGLANDTVHALLRDKSGLLWLGVNDVGLQFFNSDTSDFLYFDRYSSKLSELFTSFINKVIRFSDLEILMLTEKNGYHVNLQSGEVKPFLPDLKELPRKIAGGLIDGNILWLGDGDGNLYQVNTDIKSFNKFSLPLTKNEGVFVRNFSEGKNNELWVGTDRGVVKLERQSMTLHTLQNEDGSLFINFIRSLFVDSDNRLWIGTTSGLGMVESGSTKVKFFSIARNTDQTLSHNTIFQILESQKKEILVFNRGGIDRLVSDEPNRKIFEPFAREGTEQLEVEERIVQMDNGHYWLGQQFVLDENGNIIDQFSELDGSLQNGRSNETLVLNEEYLIRVTPSWINLISQNSQTKWRHQPQIVVTELSVDNQIRHYSYSDSDIKLKPDEDQFAVRFAALDFSEPELNQYRHQLVGYDRDWVSTPADIRQAKYTSLPPGEYQLLVQGSNRNGMWQSSPLSINVLVQPKFYQTLWFQALTLLMFLMCAFIFFRWRLKLAKQKQQEIFERKQVIQRAEMMTELLEQKNRLFAEVTHDLRTPLSTIKVQLEALQDGVLTADEKTYGTLQNRISNLNQLVSDLHQLSTSEDSISAINKQQLVLNAWLEELVSSFQPLFQQKQLALEFIDNTSHESTIMADQSRLSQVLSNLLKNSYRYTNQTGLVRVILEQAEQCSVFRVEDSAPAVSDAELEEIFERQYRSQSARESESKGSGLGLWICQSIIQAHGGEITASLSPLGGLSITIKLPIETDGK
ncbi:MAG: hypothetical protein HWE27_19370 [Gammaproteobacteria bacterium]|nr:hypothetical protein [Gammaproteobacteria bacterium]